MNVVPQLPATHGAPPPPATGAAAAAPPQAPAPAAPSMFAKLYSNPVADAHAGVYGPVLAIFTVEPAAGPAEIHAALDDAGNRFLQAYLLLGTDDHMVTIHTVGRYPALLGIAMPWDGQCFGFIRDVVGQIAQPVEFLSAMAFDLALAAVRVPTLNTMEARWVAAGAVLYLPPFGAAKPNTKLIQTRRAALLPFVAVHQCLQPLSMRQLWTVLGQPLIDGGCEAEMGVLLNWICITPLSSAAQVAPMIQLAAPPPHC